MIPTATVVPLVDASDKRFALIFQAMLPANINCFKVRVEGCFFLSQQLKRDDLLTHQTNCFLVFASFQKLFRFNLIFFHLLSDFCRCLLLGCRGGKE